MKVKSTLYYKKTPIIDCEWTLDDRARKAQKTLAMIAAEDHLRAKLTVTHVLVKEESE